MTTLTTPDLENRAPRRSVAHIIAKAVGKYGALIALLVLVVSFTIASPKYFLTSNNVLQILNQSALSAIVACGLTVVLISGQFDLSTGYLVSLAGIFCAHLILKGVPVPLAAAISLVGGLVVGLFNGSLVTRLNINALVATLGTGSVLVGINYAVSGGAPQDISTVTPGFLKLAVGDVLGIPRLVYYMVAVGAILWVVVNKTDFGRDIRAVGGNAEAARLAGVRVERVVTYAFVICALCSVIAGLLLTASLGSGQATGGDGYTLSAFAAAFLGSTVMREGQFHIIGTLVGVITVSAGFNGLALVGVPSYAQFLLQGLLLITAVAFSSVGRRLSRE